MYRWDGAATLSQAAPLPKHHRHPDHSAPCFAAPERPKARISTAPVPQTRLVRNRTLDHVLRGALLAPCLAGLALAAAVLAGFAPLPVLLTGFFVFIASLGATG